MDGSAETATPVPSGVPAEELARLLGVPSATGRRLVDAGVTTADAARALPAEELERLVPDAAERTTIRHGPGGAPADQIVEKWAGSVRRTDRGRRRKVTVAPKDSAEVLKKWVEGDDRAMEEWIRSSGEGRLPPVGPLAPPVMVPAAEAAPKEGLAAAPVLEREETVVRWLTGLLDRVKTDQFDPSTMIQEVQDLQRQLYDERQKRKQLEDEVEHVKRGSIAFIKYVRAREAKEREVALRTKEDEIAELKLRLLAFESADGRSPATEASAAPMGAAPAPSTADAVEKAAREIDQRLRDEFGEREHEYIERETELRRRIVQLEGEVRNLSAESERAEERATLLGKDAGPVGEEVARRLEEVAQREKDLVTRENELRTKFEEIRINAEEVERRRGPLEFKERELAVFDQQLQTRRQALDIEARRLEELRREAGATAVTGTSEAQRMEDLRHDLSQKEAELRAREGQLRERMQELEKMAGRAAEVEAERMHADSVAAAQEAKVHSGVRRLDDLLYGGLPVGSQVLLNGAAHTGKDVLARLFSVEGLRSGVPSIWIVTDKTYGQVREDLLGLSPGVADAEKKGMLRFVDLYSRSVGSTASIPGVRLLSSTDKNVLEQMAQTVNSFAEELKEAFKSYRLIFESVSTITAYLDTAATFRFLQPFVGRRKIDGAAAFYVLDSGMHSESDLETLEHMVDGSINLKVEQMKTFLAVRGLGEAQARTWVGYSFTKRSFNLGSFSLEHIR